MTDLVNSMRVVIDDLDRQILELVEKRMDISATIQHHRTKHGGPRVEHARERAILNRYKDALGPHGVKLGIAMLELCRGLSSVRSHVD